MISMLLRLSNGVDMIYIDFNGRCGDQFFQYSFARKLQMVLKDDSPLSFNFFNEEKWKVKINDPSFKNDLKLFNIKKNNSFVSKVENIFRFGSKRQIRIFKAYLFTKKIAKKTSITLLARYLQNKLQKNGIFYEDEYFVFRHYPKRKLNVFIKGYFEDWRFYYDSDLEEIIKKELSPLKGLVKNQHLYSITKQLNSVCVSVRSWSEISNFNDAFDARYICDKEYFDSAISKMREIMPGAIFIIFSDNLSFAKSIIKENKDIVFENEGNSLEEKIILMSSCNHFILSNSSFSWWVQYLSNRKNKTVISPSRWYKNSNDKRLIKNDWITI